LPDINLANAHRVLNLINTGAVPDSIPFLNTGLYRGKAATMFAHLPLSDIVGLTALLFTDSLCAGILQLLIRV